MEIFNEIPFEFDMEEFGKKINIENYEHLNDSLNQLLDKALPLIKPKAIYEVAYVNERAEKTVTIAETSFESEILRKNLEGIERVFPYICTCGDELEEMQENTEDYLEIYWLDALKEMSLKAARNYLLDYIKNTYKIDQMSSMNPGSGDVDLWPIEEQEKLFSVFGDVEKKIGVKLTDSFLMLPNKSVSGIFFPTEVKFESCQFCTREECPGRRAPYKGEL